ncbi:MAG: hypothetical protein RTU92_12400 [Candidatus Thorarchaeota archaeon]
MDQDDIEEFESDASIGKIRCRVMQLENGTLLLISDSDKFRMGLSALAIPPGQGRTEPTSAGFLTMGLDAALVRTLAERIAAWTNKTCMLIISVKGFNQASMMELTSILKNHFLI